jgi:hypothetical protein
MQAKKFQTVNKDKMKITLYDNLNSASVLRSLEGKMIMFYGQGSVMFFTDLKIEVIPTTTGKGWFKTTQNVTYLTGGKFYGYNTDGEFVGTYDEDNIRFTIHHYDLMKLRQRYLEFERGHKALLDKMDEIVAIKAGIHPSIIR